jgi:hypothetical protein
MDQKLYDKLFQEYVDAVSGIIRKKGITDSEKMKDCVKSNINKLDIRIARMVTVNNQTFGAFLEDTYESVGLATDIML